jgi:prepilin-type N-terminal cleavage/methylation domain-containing protein
MTMVGRPGRLRDARGMTLIELCVVIAILCILLVIAVASLLRARVSANETSAIGALRTINTSQVAYSSACGGGNFATSLLVLGRKPPGNSQGFISEDIGASTSPERSGYRLNVREGAGASAAPNDCNGTAATTNYYAVAVPMALGQTGTRAFATSQRAGIYQDPGATPPPEPFGPPSQLVQ